MSNKKQKQSVFENFNQLLKKGWKNLTPSERAWLILGIVVGLVSVVAGFLQKRESMKTDFLQKGGQFLNDYQQEQQQEQPQDSTSNANDLAKKARQQRQRQPKNSGGFQPTPEQTPTEELPEEK